MYVVQPGTQMTIGVIIEGWPTRHCHVMIDDHPLGGAAGACDSPSTFDPVYGRRSAELCAYIMGVLARASAAWEK